MRSQGINNIRQYMSYKIDCHWCRFYLFFPVETTPVSPWCFNAPGNGHPWIGKPNNNQTCHHPLATPLALARVFTKGALTCSHQHGFQQNTLAPEGANSADKLERAKHSLSSKQINLRLRSIRDAWLSLSSSSRNSNQRLLIKKDRLHDNGAN